MKFIGHITDALAKAAHGLMSEWKVFQVIEGFSSDSNYRWET